MIYFCMVEFIVTYTFCRIFLRLKKCVKSPIYNDDEAYRIP
jgi:hypothetical protein